MNREIEPTTTRIGLLANGSSARWDVAVHEALDGAEWFLELDGASYLVFQLQDLGAIGEAQRFLQSPPPGRMNRSHDESAELLLGHFGPFAVSLLWDNEDFPRCFLRVGPKAESVLRLSLDAEDVRMLADALRQVAEDLP